MMENMTDIHPRSPILAPAAPVSQQGDLTGYLQISLTTDGHLAIRGTRLLLEWFLHRLAAEGWDIELDSIRWCG